MFPKPQYIFLDDTGATTEEGILMIVLAAFAAVLLGILQSDPVRNGLTALVQRALDFSG